MALVSANSRLRRSVEATNSSSILPEDLLIEVLSRLPVKALIRFKSACRRWYDLISNPNFISTHLKISSTKRVCCDDDHENFCGLKVVAFCGVYYEYPKSIYDYLHLDLDVDLDMKETPLHVVGYCNGIFCLSSMPLLLRCEQNPTTTIVLHNPALRETRVLPPSHSCYLPDQAFDCYDEYQVLDCYNVGFGFDQKTKDHIVVKMSTFSRFRRTEEDGVKTVTVLEVYSLNTDSWRVVDNAVRDFDPYTNSTKVIRDFSSGILCWSSSYPLDQEDKEFVVVPFYIDDEMLHMRLHLPTGLPIYEMYPCFYHPSVLNGKLTLIHYYPTEDNRWVSINPDENENKNTQLDIWVMTNGCDGEKPWSTAFTLESLPECSKVLGFWNTNVIMVYDCWRSCTILYDLVTKQSMDLQLGGELEFFYKESLVSVKRTTTP